MRTLYAVIFLILSSCSSGDGIFIFGKKIDENKLYEAIHRDSVPAVKEIIKGQTLEGRSEFHNVLPRRPTWSSPCRSVEMAKFLTERGAQPKEVEVPDPNPIWGKTSIHTLDGPLEESLMLGCTDLVTYYLDVLSAEDIAKGSTKSNIVSLYADVVSKITPEKIIEASNLASKKNLELCQKGKEANCDAHKYLNKKIADFKRKPADSLFSTACSAQDYLQAHRELMRQQMEFAQRTGVATPETYNYHARRVLELTSSLNSSRQEYKKETGHNLDMKQCERVSGRLYLDPFFEGIFQ